MTQDKLRAVVLEVLCDVAPEIEPSEIGDHTDLREELELDSMDFLNFVIGLNERLGIDIPEVDYPKLSTLEGCLSYLAEKGVSVT